MRGRVLLPEVGAGADPIGQALQGDGPVAGLSDLRAALAAVKTGDPVVLHVERDGELLYVTFVAE